MYKVLKIGGKEYKLEYTMKAALYEDCVEKMTNLFGSFSGAIAEDEITDGMDDNAKREVQKMMVDSLKKQIYGLPHIALTLFYAGLMEHHGTGRNGDGTVRSIDDAENIIFDYFADHKDDELDTFADILAICIQQMSEDDFFRRTGITKMFSQGEQENPKNRAQRRTEKKVSGR